MRTTLTIDDDIAKQIRIAVATSGKSQKAIVNDALRVGMASERFLKARQPYNLLPVSMGNVIGPYDLNRALRLADEIEDEEIARKLELRK